MFYTTKNPKRLSFLTIIGLFIIFSMLIVSTIHGMASGNENATETPENTNPELEGTAGDVTDSPGQNDPAEPTSTPEIEDDVDSPEISTEEEAPSETLEDGPIPNEETATITPTPEFSPLATEEEATSEAVENTPEVPSGAETQAPTEEEAAFETAENTPEVPGVTETQTPTEVTDLSEVTEKPEQNGTGAICDQDPYCHKIDPGVNSGSYTAADPIVSFSVKAGQNLITYSSPGNSNSPLEFCWSVSINGSLVTWSRNATNSTCQDPSHFEIKWQNEPDPDPLTMTYRCRFAYNHEITVHNSADQAVSFNWASNSGEWGFGTVAAHDSYIFNTMYTNQRIIISYNYNSKAIELGMNADECQKSNDLTLDYICLDDGQHLWTVSNPNNFAIEYFWSSNVDSQGGNGAILASGSDTFITNFGTQTVTVNYSFTDESCGEESECKPLEQEPISVTAEDCKIPDSELTY